MSREEDLGRIAEALEKARSILSDFTAGAVEHRVKQGDDPVTEADLRVNDAMLACLPQEGEGWLSEETADEPSRLDRRRVWVVDPLDGTREFVAGIPEWCVSIGLVEDGRAVAGGILNPTTDQCVIGSLETGVTLNGAACHARPLESLEQTEILASRSEVKRGEWARFDDAPFKVLPMGSVAYKMSLVAAGLADATWTLVPKHEWDVAAGAALVVAAGGAVWGLDGKPPTFNREKPLLSGLLAAPSGLRDPIRRYLEACQAKT
jgi:myo-inositol-1(or 4)-monophosphatase